MKQLILLLLITLCFDLSAQKHKPKNQYNPYQKSTKIEWIPTLLRGASYGLILTSCYFIGYGIDTQNKPKLFSGVGGLAFAIGYDFTIEFNLKKKRK